MNTNNIECTLLNIKNLFGELFNEPKRFYGEDWSDWESTNYSTGGQLYPCIYILWQDINTITPLYIGETVDLGKRLNDHFSNNGWTSPKWKYVQYLSSSLLTDSLFRFLVESFCIYQLKPLDNKK